MKKLLMIAAVFGLLVCCKGNGNKGKTNDPDPQNSEQTDPQADPGAAAAEPKMKAVDLGLSVKWAECNIGANSPEEYGNYYAWGEVETKQVYTWKTYKWASGDTDKIIKYNTDIPYGTIDNLKTLQRGENPGETIDDTARALLGDKWRIPTLVEINELLGKCKWAWDGARKGYTVTGPNGNSIFLPATGYWFDTILTDKGNVGPYWASSISGDTSSHVTILTFNNEGPGTEDFPRFYGIPVRAVTE